MPVGVAVHQTLKDALLSYVETVPSSFWTAEDIFYCTIKEGNQSLTRIIEQGIPANVVGVAKSGAHVLWREGVYVDHQGKYHKNVRWLPDHTAEEISYARWLDLKLPLRETEVFAYSLLTTGQPLLPTDLAAYKRFQTWKLIS